MEYELLIPLVFLILGFGVMTLCIYSLKTGTVIIGYYRNPYITANRDRHPPAFWWGIIIFLVSSLFLIITGFIELFKVI